MRRILPTLAVIVSAFTSACFDDCTGKPGAKEYSELSRMYGSGNAQPRRQFSGYPIEKQIDIFLFSRSCTGDTRIEPLLISDGRNKISPIVERIKSTGNVWDQGYLSGTLISINTECRCISSDSQFIRDLEEVSRSLEQRHASVDPTALEIFLNNVRTLKGQLNKNNSIQYRDKWK